VKINTILVMLVILGISGLFLVTGCNVQPKQCVNDNYCSIDEQLIGNCADCMPDFVVDNSNMYATYNPSTNTIDASACVKNTGGNYEGNINIGWGMSSQKESQENYTTQQVSFVSPSAQAHAYLTVVNHQLLLSNNLQLGTDTQYACFSNEFTNVQRTQNYYIYFDVSAPPDVTEKSTDNNNGYVSVAGVAESYPYYLIEANIGDVGEYTYQGSNEQDSSDNNYNFKIYSTQYEDGQNGQSAYYSVQVAAFADSNSATNYLNNILHGIEMNVTPEYNGQVYKMMGNNQMEGSSTYVWTSNEMIVVVNAQNLNSGYDANNDPVINAYLGKHPSTMVTVTPTPTAVCGDGIIDAGEQCDGTNFDQRVNVSLAMGAAEDVSVNGQVYTVQLTGFNGTRAIVSVNTQVDYVGENESVVINGLKVDATLVSSWNNGQNGVAVLVLGSNLYCSDFGYERGSLVCTSSCTIDASQCGAGPDGGGSGKIIPDRCVASSGFACTDTQATADTLTISINNGKGYSITLGTANMILENISCNTTEASICSLGNITCNNSSHEMVNGADATIVLNGCSFNTGQNMSGRVSVRYANEEMGRTETMYIDVTKHFR